MDGFAQARRCLDLFCFDVNGLFDFVETALLKAAVARDVRGDLEFLPVGEGVNTGVEMGGGSARLDVKRACKKKCPESKRPSQAESAPCEIQRGRYEGRGSDNPPKGGAPLVDSGDDARRVGEDSP